MSNSAISSGTTPRPDWVQALDELYDLPQSRWLDVLAQISRFREFFVEGKLPPFRPVACRTIGHDRDLDVSRKATGVYLLFDRNEKLLYIGVTGISVESRVRNHAKSFEWAYEDIIEIKGDLYWVACGLERFLIDALKPEFNQR